MQRVDNAELAGRAAICESRAYHLVNAIQPHAAFLALERERLAIVRASGNIADIVGRPVETLFGLGLLDLVDGATGNELVELLSNQSAAALYTGGRSPLMVRFKDASERRKRVALLYFGGPFVCMEFPGETEGYESREKLLDTMLFRLVDEIANFDGAISDFGRIVCEALHVLTGFERIYLCEFDSDGHGFISAEHRQGELPSLLHHHFPKTDIPQRVRGIYMKNPFRTIPDVDADPIPILTAEGKPAEPLDLTASLCRQVASTHLQYVRNMGIRATASFSIVDKDRLAGIFGGHHRQPHYVSYHRLAMAQHLVNLYRTRLSFLTLRERARLLKQKQEAANALCAQFILTGCRLGAFAAEKRDAILQLMDAGDFIARFDDQFFPGRLLIQRDAQSILEAVRRNIPEEGVLATNNLSALSAELFNLRDRASGCLALSLDSERRNIFIWLRPEKRIEQKWSGNPNEAIIADAEGTIGPRRSFATYVMEVEGKSRPWDDLYTELAAHVIHAANQSLTNYYNLKARKAAERASELNSEFISKVSHELRSPIHALIGLSDAIIEKADTFPPEKRAHYKNALKERGERLLHLINDLLEISKLEKRAINFNFAMSDMRAVAESCREEVASLAERKSVEIEIRDRRRFHEAAFDPARMAQVLVNLLLNAIKFSPPSSRIIVRLSDIEAHEGDDGLMIEVADQGVGVPEHERESIFEKFRKSSRTEGAIAGIGLGLPICREIVSGHGGQLWVENNEHGGASFFVRLPRNPPDRSNI